MALKYIPSKPKLLSFSHLDILRSSTNVTSYEINKVCTLHFCYTTPLVLS